MARKWILPTLLVLFGAVICVRLGIWQLDRLSQRRAFNQHYVDMASDSPLRLPDSENLDQMEYRAVVARGTFDFSNQIAIRNQYYRDQYGYHILTPFVMEDGSAVLVDRGWIPAQGNSDRNGWEKYNEDALTTVRGVVRLSRDKGDIIGNSDPELSPGQTRLDIWNFPNIPRIQEQLPYSLLPIYIQESNPALNDPAPIRVPPDVEITEGPHLGYALQWFTFAAILLVGYPFYVRKHSQREDIGK